MNSVFRPLGGIEAQYRPSVFTTVFTAIGTFFRRVLCWTTCCFLAVSASLALVAATERMTGQMQAENMQREADRLNMHLRGDRPWPSERGSSVAVLSPVDTAYRARASKQEHRCLAEAVYYEARGEPLRGQLAVVEVIRNRVHDPEYPDSICDVVYQGAERKTGCQFSFTCDGSLDHPPEGTHWGRAEMIAAHSLMELARPATDGATHYHASYMLPYWSHTLQPTRQIGAHVFYRAPDDVYETRVPALWTVTAPSIKHSRRRIGQSARAVRAVPPVKMAVEAAQHSG